MASKKTFSHRAICAPTQSIKLEYSYYVIKEGYDNCKPQYL